MKKVLLSGLALMTCSAFYGQKMDLKKKRLTTQFEKKWSTKIAFTPSEVLEFTEGIAFSYEDQIASYAPVVLNVSLKDESFRNQITMPFEIRQFIIRHKE